MTDNDVVLTLWRYSSYAGLSKLGMIIIHKCPYRVSMQWIDAVKSGL